MPQSLSPQAHRESKAILAGVLLILLVGGYFVFRFFWAERANNRNAAQEAAGKENALENLNFMEPKVLSQKLQNKDALSLVDIRSREAYEAEHIPGSLWMSPGTLGSFSADSQQVIVIIFSAADSGAVETVRNILSGKALAVSFLQGGFDAWKLEGYQTISQGDPGSFVDQSKITYISPDELKALLQSGTRDLVLLDVRPESGFRQVHLSGAINIPLADLEKRKDEIPSAKEIIVYGENELASFQGGVRLSDLHFFAVRTLTGNSHLSTASPLFREP